MTIEKQIKDAAKKAGALDAGIASPESVNARTPPGHQTGEILPGTKSIVVLAGYGATYGALHAADARIPMVSKAYRMGKRLAAAQVVEDFIEKECGYYAVMVPMEYKDGLQPWMSMELLAEEAGLGARGINNLLLHPRYGCKIEFTATLTTMPLQPDGKLRVNPCPAPQCTKLWMERKSTLCLDVCPSSQGGCLDGAIEKGRVKWASFNQLRCSSRSRFMGSEHTMKFMDAVISEPDPFKRTQMTYSDEFFHLIEALGPGGTQFLGSCFECTKVCPVGDINYKMKPKIDPKDQPTDESGQSAG